MPAETLCLFDEWALTAARAHLPLEWPLTAAPAPLPLQSPAAPAAPPRFKFIDRQQIFFRTVDVEALIELDHPARAIWTVVEKLDLGRFSENVRALEGIAGRSTTDPRLLVSLWIYAYSRAVGSAREISRLCGYHPAYQWLTGAEPVSYHTLSTFRVAHQKALEELFVKVVGLLCSEGIVKLDRVMQDGTKVRACAASDSFRRQATLEEHLQQAREQCEALAKAGEREASWVAMQAQRRAAQERPERLEAAIQQVQQGAAESSSSREARASTSDPQARLMKQPDGGFAPSYNVQTITAAVGKAT